MLIMTIPIFGFFKLVFTLRDPGPCAGDDDSCYAQDLNDRMINSYGM